MNHSGGDATGVTPFVVQNQHASSFFLVVIDKILLILSWLGTIVTFIKNQSV